MEIYLRSWYSHGAFSSLFTFFTLGKYKTFREIKHNTNSQIQILHLNHQIVDKKKAEKVYFDKLKLKKSLK